ncbi:MAG: copper amine oxidase N-terminal domain-containing protein [Defluviitaleaceae bacterium]|nr:copper amine oxidase N-terminal domain-containing protein [Defluviitaleaceae bacterium]
MKRCISVRKYFRQGILFSLALLFALTLRVLANEIDDEDRLPVEEPIEIEEPAEIEPVWRDEMIADRTPTRRVNHITLKGVFPDIQPSFGEAYDKINEQISLAATDLIDGALRIRARTITFSYDVHAAVYNDIEVVSVVMYAGIAAVTTREAVRSINFNAATGEPLTFACVMGSDFAPLPMRILSEWTRENPERFYSARTAPLSAFYITDTLLVFLFDEALITTEVGEAGRLEMKLENIIRLTPISPDQYRILENIYYLKMVPIRPIMEQLGYNIVWEGRNARAMIWWDANSRDSGSLMMEINMGVNRYGWRGIPARTLEAPPMMDIANGRIFIPITFFDLIMPRTTYYVDEDGYIRFLAYMPAR